jgi:hypothetical protein
MAARLRPPVTSHRRPVGHPQVNPW